MNHFGYSQETPDSALSGSSNSRGLLYHEHSGYTLNDYDDGPHLPYGHDYHAHDIHPDVHSLHGYNHGHHDNHSPHDHHNSHDDHHNSHDDHHHGYHGHHNPHDDHHHGHHSHHDHDYGHHHYSGHHHLDHGHYDKHYKHALAAKTALWPLAGIALLGAAAALVSNPVLLQLGVVSGKRRRRDTEEITGPDYPTDFLSKYKEKIDLEKTGLKSNGNIRSDAKLNNVKESLKKRLLNVKPYAGSRKIRASVKSVNQISKPFLKDQRNEDRFIPIPLKLRSPKE
ncbi:zinc transporter zipt-7.2-like [Trichoplusia ni]|uniref:Zinc transporter zipt-7.2-like n=1 Tax=Trichoplusia ni TaxID=7111 RepID=A0A7E5VPK1_TRINI|nr:zinc transporter zipt-7.2-like [Trichoplusia ni]